MLQFGRGINLLSHARYRLGASGRGANEGHETTGRVCRGQAGVFGGARESSQRSIRCVRSGASGEADKVLINIPSKNIKCISNSFAVGV